MKGGEHNREGALRLHLSLNFNCRLYLRSKDDVYSRRVFEKYVKTATQSDDEQIKRLYNCHNFFIIANIQDDVLICDDYVVLLSFSSSHDRSSLD